MKKIYMTPQVEAVKIEVYCMLDGSVGGYEEELAVGGNSGGSAELDRDQDGIPWGD